MVSPNEALQQGLEPRVEAPAVAEPAVAEPAVAHPPAVAEQRPQLSYDELLEKVKQTISVERTLMRMEGSLKYCASKLENIEQRELYTHVMPHEAVRMIMKELGDWDERTSCKQVYEVLTMFSRVLRIVEGFHALGHPDTVIEEKERRTLSSGESPRGHPWLTQRGLRFSICGAVGGVISVHGNTMPVKSLRTKYKTLIDDVQVHKCRLLIVDEAVFRMLPEPEEASEAEYKEAFMRMRQCVEVLTDQEAKWLQGYDDNVAVLCFTVVSDALKELFLWTMTGNGEDILRKRAGYIRKFMQSSGLIYEEFSGLFGTHY